MKFLLFRSCVAPLTIEISPLTLTFPFGLIIYRFVAHTLRPSALILALDAPVIADTVIALFTSKICDCYITNVKGCGFNI